MPENDVPVLKPGAKFPRIRAFPKSRYKEEMALHAQAREEIRQWEENQRIREDEDRFRQKLWLGQT